MMVRIASEPKRLPASAVPAVEADLVAAQVHVLLREHAGDLARAPARRQAVRGRVAGGRGARTSEKSFVKKSYVEFRSALQTHSAFV